MPSPTEHQWAAAGESRGEASGADMRHAGDPAPPASHLDEPTLHAHLDGELSAAEQRAAERHLASCAGCSARAASLQSLFSSIEALPDISLSQDMAPAVVATLRHEAQVRPAIDRRRLWWLAPQAVAAVLLLAFALPSLSATWVTDTSTFAGASEILRDSGFSLLAQEPARALDDVTNTILQFVDAAWVSLAQLDGMTSEALAPYASWSTPTWAGLLLTLLPLWWLANRWLLRVDLPQPTTARERRAA